MKLKVLDFELHMPQKYQSFSDIYFLKALKSGSGIQKKKKSVKANLYTSINRRPLGNGSAVFEIFLHMEFSLNMF